MDMPPKWLLMAAVLAVPVAGAGAAAHAMLTRSQPLCFASGPITYQIAAASHADVRVRIDNAATHPDLRIHLADRPDNADLILADDSTVDTETACRTGGPIRTVQIAGPSAHPDITIALAHDSDSADASIYVRSARFSAEHAAALQAAIWMTSQPDRIAGR